MAVTGSERICWQNHTGQAALPQDADRTRLALAKETFGGREAAAWASRVRTNGFRPGDNH